MTLRSTIATPEGKRRYVRRLFATIANRYDFITSLLSYGQDRRWKRRLIQLAAIKPSDRVLDLACGTGDLLFAAAERASIGVGLDITHRMLVLAHRRAVKARPTDNPFPPSPCPPSASPSSPCCLLLVTGDMLALPFRPSQFDVITTGYGLRNVPDLSASLSEIHRVLTPGGRFLSLDFNRPEHPLMRAAYLAYLTVVGSVLGLALHGDANTYRYIPESIRLYPGAARVARLIEESGFSDVRVIPLLGGLMAIHTATKLPTPNSQLPNHPPWKSGVGHRGS